MDTGHKVIGQLVGHVQPPTVCAAAQPGAHHRVLIAEDEVPVARIALLHGGQGVDAPPGLILVRPVSKLKPRAIGGVPVPAGPLVLAVGAVAVEVAAHPAGVIEHAVQQNADAHFVRLFAQALKVLVRAQHGINAAVIRRAVAVVLRRLKDRAEIDGLHPQRRQIGQLFLHALQVAAKEIPVADVVALRCLALRSHGRGLVPILVYPAVSHHPGGIRDAAAAEPVGQDLVAHPLAEPAGHPVAAVVDGELILAGFQLPAPKPGEPERIPHKAHIVPGVHRAGKFIPHPVRIRPRHGNGLGAVPVKLIAERDLAPAEAHRSWRAQGQAHRLPGAHRATGGLTAKVPRIKHIAFVHVIHLLLSHVHSPSSAGRVSPFGAVVSSSAKAAPSSAGAASCTVVSAGATGCAV